MTHTEFLERLAALGLSESAFAAQVSELGGERLPPGTVHNWAQGRREIPPVVPALLTLLDLLARVAD